MYPASWWRIALRALDDDPRVPVLLNPSVTRDAFECPGFPARRWTVLSSSSLLSRPWWNFLQSSSSWRWESGKRSVLSQRSVFSTAIKQLPVAAADVDTLCRWTTQPRPFLWLAIKQGTLVHSGDHAYVKHGTANSWADGARTLVGQDSIDFDITLSNVNSQDGTAKLVVRHVPPAQPQIKVPAKWMEAPVSDQPNNWVEVTKTGAGKYLGEVGKETFDVEMMVSLADGRILSATMDNPVMVSARECTDEAITHCGQPQHYQIRRQIELRLAQ